MALPERLGVADTATPKVQLTKKSIAAKIYSKLKRLSPKTTVEGALSNQKVNAETPVKMGNTVTTPEKKTNTIPKESTPQPKENKLGPLPGSVTKLTRKPSWKRRPKPAHSGVPIPEKMRLLQERLKDSNDSF